MGLLKKTNDINSPEKPSTENNLEKLQTIVFNGGSLIYFLGWLTIAINVGLYILSILGENYVGFGFRVSDLAGAWAVTGPSIVLVILGNRIRKLQDKNIEVYLWVVALILLLLLVLILSTGGNVGILFLIVLANTIFSISSARKLMKIKEFSSTLVSPKYRLNGKGWLAFAVLAIALFFVALDLDSRGWWFEYYPKEELIRQLVKDARNEIDFPMKVDSMSELTDITGQPGAIRFEYTLHNIDDTSRVTNTAIRNAVAPAVCSDKITSDILNADVNIEYSYKLSGTLQTYFVTFTKADCQ